MTTLTTSQLRDALTYAEGLEKSLKVLSDDPPWDGSGLHLILPAIIPLVTDVRGDDRPVAWLIANDFNGYDISTTDPEESK